MKRTALPFAWLARLVLLPVSGLRRAAPLTGSRLTAAAIGSASHEIET